MPATALATRPATSAADASAATPAAAALVDFLTATREHTELFFDSGAVTLGVSTVELAPTDIPAYGFLRSILVDVTIASTGNSATVANFEDSPYSAINTIAINDVNSTPVYGPNSGIAAYLADKYSGARGSYDPQLTPGTSTLTVGAGATAGSGRFVVRLPVEAIARTGLGSLANANSSTTYKLRCTLNNLLGIFTTAPNGTVTARVKYYLEAYSVPAATDWRGRPQQQLPPGNGTTNYWSRYVAPAVSIGQNTVRLPRVGNYIRDLILIFRAANGTRATAESTGLPDPINLFVDTRLWHQQSPVIARRLEGERSQMLTPNFESPGGPRNGVVVFDQMHEFMGRYGMETGAGWLPTLQSTRFEIQFQSLFAGTLEVLTNDVAPPSGAAM